jgi:AAA+ ATPase superfamily predicted ATPase
VQAAHILPRRGGDCSVEMNIAAELLDEYAALHREGDSLLREELRKIENYYAVLLAISSGATSNRAIADYAQY